MSQLIDITVLSDWAWRPYDDHDFLRDDLFADRRAKPSHGWHRERQLMFDDGDSFGSVEWHFGETPPRNPEVFGDVA